MNVNNPFSQTLSCSIPNNMKEESLPNTYKLASAKRATIHNISRIDTGVTPVQSSTCV